MFAEAADRNVVRVELESGLKHEFTLLSARQPLVRTSMCVSSHEHWHCGLVDVPSSCGACGRGVHEHLPFPDAVERV